MVQLITLGKFALGLAFPVYGLLYYSQNRIAKKFSQQPYYQEALKLLDGYKPVTEKLGEPIHASKIDLSDEFNYHDDKIARVKIPVKGSKSSGHLLVNATKNEINRWDIDTLEIMYKNSKFKFYDSKFVKRD